MCRERSSLGDTTLAEAFLSEDVASHIQSWEVQLVLEFCDKGTLRDVMDDPAGQHSGPFLRHGTAGVRGCRGFKGLLTDMRKFIGFLFG
jgi:hypothetical protein